MPRSELPVVNGAIGLRLFGAALLCGLVLPLATEGHAETAPTPSLVAPSAAPGQDNRFAIAGQTSDESEPGFLTGLFAPSRSNLLGDMFGLRTMLGSYGITIGLTDTDEVLGNLSGRPPARCDI